jgi:hypothetical protein
MSSYAHRNFTFYTRELYILYIYITTFVFPLFTFHFRESTIVLYAYEVCYALERFLAEHICSRSRCLFLLF